MKVIGHQTITNQSHRDLFMCLSHERDEGRKVVWFVEDIGSTISLIQDMVNVSTL